MEYIKTGQTCSHLTQIIGLDLPEGIKSFYFFCSSISFICINFILCHSSYFNSFSTVLPDLLRLLLVSVHYIMVNFFVPLLLLFYFVVFFNDFYFYLFR